VLKHALKRRCHQPRVASIRPIVRCRVDMVLGEGFLVKLFNLLLRQNRVKGCNRYYMGRMGGLDEYSGACSTGGAKD
jgi:hypothetical protein